MHTYRFGNLELSSARRSVSAGTDSVDLTYRQFEALRVLAEAEGSVVDRDSLHKQIWPEAVVDDATLNKCISEVRRAIAEHDPDAEYLETVRGRGYRIAVPIERIQAKDQTSDSNLRAVGSPAADATVDAPNWGSSRRVALWLAAGAVLLAVGWNTWSTSSRASEVEALRAEGQRLYQAKEYPDAVRMMRQAIALAPNEGAIYGELAHAVHKMRDPRLEATQAIELAEKGVELSPECAECQGTLGFFLFYHGWEWERAREHYAEALRLEPEHSGIRTSYAFLLAATGDTAAAVEQAEMAAAAQPLAAGRHAALAQVLYLSRRYDEALEAANRALELDQSRSDAWEYLARARFRMGQTEEGVRTMITERYKQHSAEVGAAVDSGGGEAGLRKLLELTGGWPERSNLSWRRAAWLALLGEDDAALEALEEAVRIRNVNLMFVAVDPIYGHLREHPRYQAVLREMGLATVPVEVTAR